MCFSQIVCMLSWDLGEFWDDFVCLSHCQQFFFMIFRDCVESFRNFPVEGWIISASLPRIFSNFRGIIGMILGLVDCVGIIWISVFTHFQRFLLIFRGITGMILGLADCQSGDDMNFSFHSFSAIFADL